MGMQLKEMKPSKGRNITAGDTEVLSNDITHLVGGTSKSY